MTWKDEGEAERQKWAEGSYLGLHCPLINSYSQADKHQELSGAEMWLKECADSGGRSREDWAWTVAFIWALPLSVWRMPPSQPN